MSHKLGALAILGIAACCGCGERLIPVTGRILLRDDKPAANVTVVFEDPSQQRMATGVTDDGGQYTLTQPPAIQGVPAGAYKVSVFHPSPADSSQAQVKDLFDLKYERSDQSGLVAEVTPDKTRFDFRLDPPAPMN
jgi:hypothetical protein